MVKIHCNIPQASHHLRENMQTSAELFINGKSYLVKHITKIDRSNAEHFGRCLLGGLLTGISLSLLYLFNQKVKELFQKTRRIDVFLEERPKPSHLPPNSLIPRPAPPTLPSSSPSTTIDPKKPIGSSPRMDHVEGKKHVLKDGVVYEVPVLDQTLQKGGHQHCGFHAFKNALIGLGVMAQDPGFEPKQLKDPKTYLTIKQAVDRFKDPGGADEEDVAINALMDALEYLYKPAGQLPSSLNTYHELLQSHFHHICLFNAQEEGGQLVLSGGGGGSSNLNSLANLYEFSQRKGPKAQAFLIGFEGHWITLIVHVDAKGEQVWSGFDSYYSGPSCRARFEKGIQLIKRNLDNLQAFLLKGYEDAVGEEIQRKVRWFDENGDLKNKAEDEGELLKNAPEFLTMLSDSYEFMKRTSWLTSNDPMKVNYVKKLVEYLTFYAKILKKPIMTDKVLGPMVHDLCKDILRESVYPFGEPPAQLAAHPEFQRLKQADHFVGVSDATVHFYLCEDGGENLYDYGWGCGWRSIKTVFSAIPKVNQASVLTLFNQYSEESKLVEAYKSINPLMTPEQEQEIRLSAPVHHNNWTEPFIGYLHMQRLGVACSLEIYGRYPDKMDSPKFAYKEDFIQTFPQFLDRLEKHFEKYKSPVMLDNGRYAFALLGIKKSTDTVEFLIGDPHTSLADESIYTVVFNKEGRHLSNTAKQKNCFSVSPQKIYFNGGSWMLLFPQPQENN